VAEDPNRSGKPNPLVTAARYSEIGFIIPAAVFLGFGLGKLLDYWLHTHWIYVAGVIVAGSRTNEIFIENGRFHGRQIAAHLKQTLSGT